MEHIKKRNLPFFIFLFIFVFSISPFTLPLSAEEIEIDTEQLRQNLKMEEFELEVSDIDGAVLIKTDTGWRQAEEGEVLNENDVISTTDGAATLEIPGITYLKMNDNTEMKVEKLSQQIDKDGVLLEKEEILRNDIELDVKMGEIRNRVRQHDRIRSDVKLKSPTAVAGIRGTSYRCIIEERGSTSCSVLDGAIDFYNRLDPRFRRQLTARQRSSLLPDREEPEEPEEITEEDEEILTEFKQESENRLRQRPYAGALSLDNQRFERDGQGIYYINKTIYSPQEYTLAGLAGVREEEAELTEIIVNFKDEEKRVRGLEEWETTLKIDPPEKGEETTIDGQIQVTDSLETRSRSYPFKIIFYRPDPADGIPEELREGELPVEINTIGSLAAEEIAFPTTVTDREMYEGVTASGLVVEEGIRLEGTVETDSPLAAVVYSVDEGNNWQPTDGLKEWSVLIDNSQLKNSQQLSVSIVAWTEDGYLSETVKAGPFVFEEDPSVVPFDYQQGEVDVNFTTIDEMAVDDIDFPYYLSGEQLNNDQLLITGSAGADSPIEAVAYRVNGGEWQLAEGEEDWSISLPTSSDATFEIEAQAWTTGKIIGEIVTLGEINYTVQQTIPPSNYQQGEVEIFVSEIAGFIYDEMEFPFHLFKDDLEAGEIVIRGTADAEATVEAVAYSLDNGSNWELTDGGADWTIRLPAGSENYNIRIVGWTVNGIIGDEYSIDEINYSDVTCNQHLETLLREQLEEIERENSREIVSSFSEDFLYEDNQSAVEMDLSEFERFLKDFFRKNRNLTVTSNIHQVYASSSGGQINFEMEWRGTNDAANRPFIIFADNISLDYQRAVTGEFELYNYSDFPFYQYLFHRENIYIPDLGGIALEDLQTHSDTQEADILTSTFEPAMFTNTLEIGGMIADGGLLQLSAGSFSDVNSISKLPGGYRESVGIEVGDIFAVNIRDYYGEPLTALIEIINISSSYVQVRVISGRTAYGIPEQPVLDYRGVNPF